MKQIKELISSYFMELWIQKETTYSQWKAIKKRTQMSLPPFRNESGPWARDDIQRPKYFQKAWNKYFNKIESKKIYLDLTIIDNIPPNGGTTEKMKSQTKHMRSYPLRIWMESGRGIIDTKPETTHDIWFHRPLSLLSIISKLLSGYSFNVWNF